jgi:hypothetical protein
MSWVDSLKKGWSTIVTFGCIVVASLVLAWQEAASNVPAGIAIPRLGGAWHYVPLALMTAAGVSWLIGHYRKTPSKPSQLFQPSQQRSTSFPSLSVLLGQAPQITFDPSQYFRLAYYSPITAEVENNFKIIAERFFQPADREAFFTRFIGVGLVSYLHDMTWAYIFKSQLLVIKEVNRRSGYIMPLSDAKVYYDSAVLEYPQVYANYSFQQWMDYMYSQQLLIKHPSDMLELTHRAKDLLKYLEHWGRDANIKAG